MMRAIWTDAEGDEIELDEYTTDGVLVNGVCFMEAKGETVFAFTPDDAESFAAYLRAWALKQREGV